MDSKEVVTQSLGLFGTDNEGHAHVHIPVFDLHATTFKDPATSHSKQLRTRLVALHQDIALVLAAIERTQFTKDNAESCPVLRERWRLYIAADIHLFHFELRSLLDDLAQLIASAVGQSGTLPKSFNGLKNGADKKYVKQLPPEIVTLLGTTGWFDTMRHTRDQISHYGAEALVFDTQDASITFQIHTPGMARLITEPVLMYNPNVAHFDRYAALMLANLLLFLKDLGEILKRQDSTGITITPTRLSGPGLDVLYQWLTNLNSLLPVTPQG